MKSDLSQITAVFRFISAPNSCSLSTAKESVYFYTINLEQNLKACSAQCAESPQRARRVKVISISICGVNFFIAANKTNLEKNKVVLRFLKEGTLGNLPFLTQKNRSVHFSPWAPCFSLDFHYTDRLLTSPISLIPRAATTHFINFSLGTTAMQANTVFDQRISLRAERKKNFSNYILACPQDASTYFSRVTCPHIFLA